MINVKSLDPNKIKMGKMSYKILFTTLDYLSYAKINSVNPLYFFINNINGCVEENNGNKYLIYYN